MEQKPDQTHLISRELPEAQWQEWRTFVEHEFGVPVPDAALDKFKILLAELLDWNEKMNLVSFRSSAEILWRHFADSLAGLRLCAGRTACTAADIGTGAGFPGLPIKCVLPGIQMTMVESITKKCTFIEHMAAALSLSGIRICNDRAEVLGQDPAHRGKYEIVFSRAVTKFSPNLEIALPLAQTGGHALIYKTEASAYGAEGLPSVTNALAHLGGKLANQFTYRLPGQEQTYCVLDFVKTKHTPAQFPRRAGIPEKKPL